MHELGITEDLLAHVLEHAAEAGIKKVTSVKLSLGDLSGLEPDSITLCFESASQGTPAQGAEVVFERIEAQLRCRFCGHVFTPTQFDEPCPQCQRLNLEVLNGQDFYLQSIEGE